jgi:hypothetical protein
LKLKIAVFASQCRFPQLCLTSAWLAARVSGSWRDDVTTDAFKPSLLVDDTAKMALGFEHLGFH